MALFIALWIGGPLGSYGVTVGTVLGSVAIAVSSIGQGTGRDKWLIAALGTAVVGTCAAIDTLDQLHTVRLKAALEQDIQSYGQGDHKRDVAAFLGDRLHDCLNRANPADVDLDHCDDLESLFEHIDPVNGGVQYYKAEILRYRGRLEDSDGQLYGYLEADRRLRPAGAPDDGLATVCDDNGTGYCRQRTAWVCHTLANDYYRRGCDAAGPAQRRSRFERAQQYMQCVERNYKGGFDNHLSTRPLDSAQLTAALDLELKDSNRRCSASSAR